MLKRLTLLAAMALTLMGASECEGQKASVGAKREQAATHQLQDQASTAVGMPAHSLDISPRSRRHFGHTIGDGIPDLEHCVTGNFHSISSKQDPVFVKLFVGSRYILGF